MQRRTKKPKNGQTIVTNRKTDRQTNGKTVKQTCTQTDILTHTSLQRNTSLTTTKIQLLT